jgi:hypothetical protein
MGASVVALAFAAACGDDDASADDTTGADAITVEDCDELLTQEACESAVADGECAWFDVSVPGPECSSTTVVPQCVGMSYAGEGCQPMSCAGGASVDGFFRTVDGAAQVFANPDCGLIASDGWQSCVADPPAECACLCG